MILLNTTFAVDPAISGEVIAWLRQEYIPAAEASGFTGIMLSRVLTNAADADAMSLALQMKVSDTQAADDWHRHHGGRLLDDMSHRWPQRVLPFVTHLEIL